MIVKQLIDEEIEIVRSKLIKFNLFIYFKKIYLDIGRIDAELAEEGADVAQLREERAEKVKRLNILKDAWAKLKSKFQRIIKASLKCKSYIYWYNDRLNTKHLNF